MSGGGFISDRLDTLPPPTKEVFFEAGPTRPLHKLTPKQERRLVDYLDAQFQSLERDYNRRSSPTSPLPTLSALLARLLPLLHLILQIPPIDPHTSLRVSYLLLLTSSISRWIVGYPIVGFVSGGEPTGPLAGENTGSSAEEVMEDLLDLFAELDRGWLIVLRGEVWENGEGRGREGSWRAGTVEGEMRRQLIIGKGVTMTDKIRLRSAILNIRENILTWAEPTPPACAPSVASTSQASAEVIPPDGEEDDEDDEEMEEYNPNPTPAPNANPSLPPPRAARPTPISVEYEEDALEARVIRLLNGTLQALADLSGGAG